MTGRLGGGGLGVSLGGAALLFVATARVAAAAPEREATGVYERDAVEVAPADQVSFELVDIDNRLGDVRVEGHDGASVMIFAFKRAPDDDSLDRLKVSLIPSPAGPVRIGTSITTANEARPLRAGTVKIDLVVRAPRGARVRAQVWNGTLTVTGMDAGAELIANRGNIAVRHCSGTIVSHSARGSQRFNEVVGTVDAQGMFGDLDFQLVRGESLDASTHEGDIAGSRIHARHVALRATRGDVRFAGTLLVGGSYRLSTYQGNVEVQLARLVRTPVRVVSRAPRGAVRAPAGVRLVRAAGGAMVAELDDRSSERAEPRLLSERGSALVELQSRLGNVRFTVLESETPATGE